jgi:hypothetical protein
MDVATTRSVTTTGAGGSRSGSSQPTGTSLRASTPACTRKRIKVSRAALTARGSQCWPASSNSAMRPPCASANSPWSRMRTPSAWPASTTTCAAVRKPWANAMLRARVPVTSRGAQGSCMECRSSRCVARSTKGRSWRARSSSALRRGPSRTSAAQTRLKSSSIKREASGCAASKRSKAAMLQKASVTRPRAGCQPAASSSASATAPENSLPCTSAVTRISGPGAAPLRSCT